MANDSPATILFSSDNTEIAINNGYPSSGAHGILSMGSDGTNSRFIKVDSLGSTFVTGLGSAGSPSGGIVSIQGVSGGSPLTVSFSDNAARLLGIIYGSQGQQLKQTATNYNLASELYTGGTAYDARQIRYLTTSDVVTANAGTGTFAISAAFLPLPLGAATDSVLSTLLSESAFTGRINTLGQKTSAASTPVVLASDQSSLGVSVSSLPLPLGATTETTLGTRLADATFTGRINTLGQKTSAASTPVVIASDQSALGVSGTITANAGTGDFTIVQSTAANLNATVIGTVTANIGTTNGVALDATLTDGSQRNKITDGTNNAAVKAASTAAGVLDPALVVAISPNNTVAVSAASLPLPSGAATETTLGTRLAETTFTSRINTLGQKTSVNSTPVVISSDQSAIPVTGSITTTNPSVGTNNSSIPTSSTLIAGSSDGSLLRPIKTTEDGYVYITGNIASAPPDVTDRAGRLLGVVYGSQGQQIKQTATNYNLQTELATGGTLYDARQIRALTASDVVTANQGGTWTISANAGTGTFAISAASLPLPSGAATETTLGTRLADATFTGRINTLGQKTATNSTPVVIASDQSTLGVSAASLPLPSGAATETTLGNRLADSTFTTRINTLGQKTSANSTPVVLASDQSTLGVSGTVTANAGTGTFAISASSLPLPSGASTETTLGTRLADTTFTGRINTQGQKAMAASTPVVIASDQSTLGVSGTVTANAGTGNFTVTQATAGNLNATVTGTVDISDKAARLVGIVYGSQSQQLKQTATNYNLASELYTGGTAYDARSIRALTASDVVTANQGGTWTVSANAGTGTFAISASALPLPTGASTETTLGTRLAEATFTGRINTLGQKTAANSTPVVLASDQSTLGVSGTVTANAGTGTFAISASALPLPTGASTETTLGTRLADATFTGRINTQGQKAMAASTPVVIASDQSSLAVTGTFWQATQPISASALPLPSGAATETTLGTRLAEATFTTRINTLGQKASTASTPVVLASDQSALTVSQATAASLNATVVQGTAASASGGWPTKITDGTNLAAVKAASTAAVASDPALVVAISPNNPLSIGGSSTPSDTFANPTTAMLSQSFSMGYNGATWDRLRSSTANGLVVDVSRVQGTLEVVQSTAASLNATVVGLGSAGSPSGGILTIQGSADGTPIPITGSISASNPSVSTNSGAIPTSSTLIGGSDGTYLRPLLTDTSGGILIAGNNTSYAPYYDSKPEGTSNLSIDPSGALSVRGPILTDEGGYSTSFSGSAIYILCGICTFTNGSDVVTGVGFDGYDVHLGDYIKLSTDADSAYIQIDSITNNSMVLIGPYTGTSGTGIGYAVMEKPVIGSGASISITNGQAVIVAGTTAGAITELERDCDILPAVFEKELLISQRIANQNIYVGVYDESSNGPKYYSWFRFNGTDSRLVICETAHNRSAIPGAYDIQTTNFYMSQDTNTGLYNRYRIEVKASEVNFIINDRIVARHKKVIMKSSDFLTFTTRVINGTTPASSTTVYQNYSRVNNFNELVMTLNTKDSTLFKEAQLLGDESGIPMKAVPHPEFRTTFANVFSNTIDPAYWTLMATGSGQTVNQTAGNLVLTTGTTTNSETVIRSNRFFTGQFMFRAKAISSARSANQQFIFELVDIIGDGLALTINSATLITVTIPNNPFTAINVGQFVKISIFTGTAGMIPGRYAIASVSGNNVNFTVAGFPASGSGTCSLYGWNYHHIIYDTATVTSAKYDAQRMGWASGDTTLAINTTVTGHYVLLQKNNGDVLISDGLVASAATYGMTGRGSRVENIPFNDCKLYLQVRSVNGTVAPTALTWTVGFITVEEYAAMPTELLIGARGNMNTVNVGTMPTTTVTGTIVASGTVGPGAANAAVSGNPVRIGASDGTNTRNVLSDATGRLLISSSDTTATGALGALNAANTIALNGTYSAGFQLLAGTLVGTLVPEWSLDAGTTWVAGLFEDPKTGARVGSLVYASNNTAAQKSIIMPGGASNVRVRVSAYTSGTAAGTIRSSAVQLPRLNSVSEIGTVTSVAYSATNVTLLAANVNRLGFTITNRSSTTLYVKFGATATTTTSFSVIIPTNGTYTYPNTTIYTGIIDGIWDATGSNSAVITELT